MVATRIQQIRTIKNWKQHYVAKAMKITQQGYSFLEQGHGSPRIDTLKRFCDVMQIEMWFLLAFDIDITAESLAKYGKRGFGDLVTEHKTMEQKLEFLQYKMKNSGEPMLLEKMRPFALAAGV